MSRREHVETTLALGDSQERTKRGTHDRYTFSPVSSPGDAIEAAKPAYPSLSTLLRNAATMLGCTHEQADTLGAWVLRGLWDARQRHRMAMVDAYALGERRVMTADDGEEVG